MLNRAHWWGRLRMAVWPHFAKCNCMCMHAECGHGCAQLCACRSAAGLPYSLFDMGSCPLERHHRPVLIGKMQCAAQGKRCPSPELSLGWWSGLIHRQCLKRLLAGMRVDKVLEASPREQRLAQQSSVCHRTFQTSAGRCSRKAVGATARIVPHHGCAKAACSITSASQTRTRKRCTESCSHTQRRSASGQTHA